VAKAAHEMDVNKMIEKFMMELAAPPSKHTATGCTICFAAADIVDVKFMLT